jgi:hypothetical protein
MRNAERRGVGGSRKINTAELTVLQKKSVVLAVRATISAVNLL